MHRSAFTLLLALPFACAAGTARYPIDLEQKLNGLDIVATATPGAVAVVTLENRSKVTARCRAAFEGGLATPRTRAAKVAPGATATLSYKIRDDIARLHVRLACTPAQADR